VARLIGSGRIAPLSIAVLALLLLAPFAGLDPVRGVTFSNAPFSDEAWNLMGARNLVLFGNATTDAWATWLLAIPFTAIEAAAFAVFGVKLVVARLVIIGAVTLTGAGITAALGGVVGHRAAWVAGVAYVTSALVLFYGRLAFLEPLVGLFLAVGVLSLTGAARGAAVRWGILGGGALALAVMTKGLALPSAVAVILVVLVLAGRVAWTRRWLAGAVPVAAALAAGWTLLVLLPNRQAVRAVLTTIYPPFNLPTRPGEAVHRLASLPFADDVLLLAGPLLLVAAIGTLRLVRSVRREGVTAAGAAGLAGLAALLAGLLVLGLVDYQPNRYVVAILPLAAIVAGWALPATDRIGWRGRPWNPPRWAAPIAAAILLASPGIVAQAGWMRSAGTEVARIQAVVLAALPAGATITGQYAPLVALGAPVRTLVPFKSVNDGDLYAEGTRYVAWTDKGPGWAANHPAAWAARRTIACMTWGKVPERTCVYELPDVPGG
jgi:hypothetical protein